MQASAPGHNIYESLQHAATMTATLPPLPQHDVCLVSSWRHLTGGCECHPGQGQAVGAKCCQAQGSSSHGGQDARELAGRVLQGSSLGLLKLAERTLTRRVAATEAVQGCCHQAWEVTVTMARVWRMFLPFHTAGSRHSPVNNPWQALM